MPSQFRAGLFHHLQVARHLKNSDETSTFGVPWREPSYFRGQANPIGGDAEVSVIESVAVVGDTIGRDSEPHMNLVRRGMGQRDSS
jgi:hypothetical protein